MATYYGVGSSTSLNAGFLIPVLVCWPLQMKPKHKEEKKENNPKGEELTDKKGRKHRLERCCGLYFAKNESDERDRSSWIRMALNSWPSCLHLQSAGTTGV